MSRGTSRPQFKGDTAAAFSPLDVSGLALWLDAADSSTVTLDGSNNVEEWRDKSGNSRHMTQAIALQRPAYGTQTQNGLNLIVTDAAGQTRMQTGNIAVTAWFGTNRQTMTLFRVVRSISGTINGGIAREGGITTDFILFRPTQLNLWFINNVNQGAAGDYGLTLPTGNMDGLAHEFDLSVPIVRVRRNWTQVTTLTPTSTSGHTSGINMFYRINWDSLAATSYHAEHLIYNRILTAGEISQVETYLRTKWGL